MLDWLRRLFAPRRVEVEVRLPSLDMDRQHLERMIERLNETLSDGRNRL